MNPKLSIALSLALFAGLALAQPKPPPPPAARDSPIVQKLLAQPVTDDLEQLEVVGTALDTLGMHDETKGLGEFIERQRALRLLGEPPLQAASVADANRIGLETWRHDHPQNSKALKEKIGSSFVAVKRLTDPPGLNENYEVPLGDGFWGSRFGADSTTIFVEVRNVTDQPIGQFSLYVILDPRDQRLEFSCNTSRPPPQLGPREAIRVVCLHSVTGSSARLAALRARTKGPVDFETRNGELSLSRDPYDIASRADALLYGLTCADTGTCADVRMQAQRARLHGHVLWLPLAAAVLAGLFIMVTVRFMPSRLRAGSSSIMVAALAGMAIVLTADLAAWSAGWGMNWLHGGLPALFQQSVFAGVAICFMALVLRARASLAYSLLLLAGPVVVLAYGLAGNADGLAMAVMAAIIGGPAALGLLTLGIFCRSAVKRGT